MVDELGTHFKFSKLTGSEVQNIFVLWMQNVLNMPIGLSTNAIQSYCKEMNIKYTDLLNAADRLDINVALLDDVIGEYIKESNPSIQNHQ
jgi:hypothetical protein